MQKGKSKKLRVKKTTFDEEQALKDQEFLMLEPNERLRLHKIIRKRIWGDKYNKLVLKGLKVTKRKGD
jgi:hypothetical protein